MPDCSFFIYQVGKWGEKSIFRVIDRRLYSSDWDQGKRYWIFKQLWLAWLHFLEMARLHGLVPNHGISMSSEDSVFYFLKFVLFFYYITIPVLPWHPPVGTVGACASGGPSSSNLCSWWLWLHYSLLQEQAGQILRWFLSSVPGSGDHSSRYKQVCGVSHHWYRGVSCTADGSGCWLGHRHSFPEGLLKTVFGSHVVDASRLPLMLPCSLSDSLWFLWPKGSFLFLFLIA